MTPRQDAARRLPPLECGCRDPEARSHVAGRCRWPGGQLAETAGAREGRAAMLEHFAALGYDVSWCAPTWAPR